MTNSTKKKRIRVWTPEDRAAHRVFEKSRREAFNDSLIDLARQVPSLAGTRRLNKHMIVDHSIARHRSQRQMCLSAACELRDILAERDELLAEVNQWRSASGSTLPLREARPMGQHLQNLLTVDNESFGAFPNGFGENPAGGGSGDDPEELGDITTKNSNVHMPTIPEMLPQEQQTHPAPQASSNSPKELVPDLLDFRASSLHAPTPVIFATDNILDLEGSLDFGHLLHDHHAIGIHTLPTPLPDSTHHASDIVSVPLDAELHAHVQDGFGTRSDNEIPVQPATFADIVYEPFHQMQEPYTHQSANAHQTVYST